MRFVTASLSETRGRPENQDALGQVGGDGWGAWVVADGLGGHPGGGVAARLAVEAVLDSLKSRPECSPEAVQVHLESAQKALLARQRTTPELKDMRTTVILVVADRTTAVAGHLGDSRYYHFRRGRLIFRTKDHSVPQALVNAGELSPEDLRRHPDRHRLLRALGAAEDFRPAISEPRELAPGDALLLCTDGFWGHLTDTELETALREAATPQDWLRRLTFKIQSQATPEADNCTAIGIFLEAGKDPNRV